MTQDPDPTENVGRPPSISDVARAARVSPATVSRVLNGNESVAGDLKERVLAAVEQVDYRRNRIARNLRRQKVDMIGVVVSDIENPHFSEAVRVIEDRAYQLGYRLLLCNTDETSEKQRLYLEMLADERVQSVIVSPVDDTGVGIGALTDLGISVVSFDRRVRASEIDSVTVDNRDGMRRLTQHMIDLGHRDITFLGGRSHVETGSSRLAGYRDAMEAEGLRVSTVAGEFRSDQAQRAVEEFLEQKPDTTALLVGNNLMTLGAIRALRGAGVPIPGGMAVAAVDDPPWAALLDPPLTTLAQPVREMAEAAMDLAVARIQDPTRPPRHMVFTMQLKVRESSGGQV